MVPSGTLSSLATSSVVKRASASALAPSPDSGTSTGAIAVGGQFGSGQDHITGISRSYGSAGRTTPLWTRGLGVLAPLLMLLIAVSRWAPRLDGVVAERMYDSYPDLLALLPDVEFT